MENQPVRWQPGPFCRLANKASSIHGMGLFVMDGSLCGKIEWAPLVRKEQTGSHFQTLSVSSAAEIGEEPNEGLFFRKSR